jgi:hypothetical protein
MACQTLDPLVIPSWPKRRCSIIGRHRQISTLPGFKLHLRDKTLMCRYRISHCSTCPQIPYSIDIFFTHTAQLDGHQGRSWLLGQVSQYNLPDLRSQARACASSPQDAAGEPSGWKLTPYAPLLCPSWSKSCVPVLTSHSLQVLSNLVVLPRWMESKVSKTIQVTTERR